MQLQLKYMKITIRSLTIIFCLIIVAIGYLFWQWSGPKGKTDIYQTTKVRVGNIAETVIANGNLNPVTLVNVGAQVTGKVQKIYVDFNDCVTAGQVLLELDATLLQAQVAQSVAGVYKARVALDLARANHKRGEVLYKNRVITQQEREQLQQKFDAANADMQAAQAKLAGDRANLNYATIRSPISGVIVNRQVDVGQTVTAAFQTPVLFQIAQDLSKMQIDTSFAEADVGKIASGQVATFTVDAFPGRSFMGLVQQIRLTPTIQQNVVTYNAVVKVNNLDGILLPGMTAYVTVTTAKRKNVLLVPNAAIRFKPRNDSALVNTKKAGYDNVYIIVNNKLTSVSCKLGISDDHYTEISHTTLKAHDNVVTGYVLQDGDSSSSLRLRML